MTKNFNDIEILAPCGSYDILTAAVKAGADACYIGGSKFGARAYAENLQDDLILKAIDYAHLHETKLYLTLNTLLKNTEIKQLASYIIPYYEAGLDAVIVQDLGVFNFIKDYFPDIPTHCSTQMNITSVHGARYMKSLGADRIVTAREMSLEEIRHIKDCVDIEIESFVHGAMCYSYSGQCLMSSYVGGRSGNRGRCAQPCRKCYNGEYVLSMKDMCTLENIPDIIEAGVDSLKIEGRMKNEYYVASAVDAYKQMANDYFQGVFSRNKALEYKKKLANIYNRGGFCDGYYFMHNGPEMISKERPNNMGIEVGKLVGVLNGKIEIKLYEQLYKGDVLEIKLKDESSIDITSGISANAGQKVTLNSPKTKLIKANQSIYRTRCNKILEDVTNTILNEKKNIYLKGEFVGTIGKPMSLVLSTCIFGKEYFATAETENVVEESKNVMADSEQIKEKLSQLGNTDYILDSIDINIDASSFVPAGILKKIRRDTIAKLEDTISKSFRRTADYGMNINSFINDTDKKFDNQHKDTTVLNVGVKTIKQLEAILQYNNVSGIYMDRHLYDIAYNSNIIQCIKEKNIKLYIELPYIIKNHFDILSYVPDNIDGIYIRNIDGYACYITNRDHLMKYKIILGFSLYAYNDLSGTFLSANDTAIEVPKELSFNEIKELSYGNKEIVLYEYQQTMVSAQCVNKTRFGCDNKNKVITITDDKGNNFYSMAICNECCNVVYNGIPFIITDKLDISSINMLGVDSLRVNFTIEDPDKVNKVFNNYIMPYINSTKTINILDKHTSGHYFRGVE